MSIKEIITNENFKFNLKQFHAFNKWFFGDDGRKIELDYINSDSEVYTNNLSCLSRSYLKCRQVYYIEILYKKSFYNITNSNRHFTSCELIMIVNTLQFMCNINKIELKEFYLNNILSLNLNDSTKKELDSLIL